MAEIENKNAAKRSDFFLPMASAKTPAPKPPKIQPIKAEPTAQPCSAVEKPK